MRALWVTGLGNSTIILSHSKCSYRTDNNISDTSASHCQVTVYRIVSYKGLSVDNLAMAMASDNLAYFI